MDYLNKELEELFKDKIDNGEIEPVKYKHLVKVQMDKEENKMERIDTFVIKVPFFVLSPYMEHDIRTWDCTGPCYANISTRDSEIEVISKIYHYVTDDYKDNLRLYGLEELEEDDEDEEVVEEEEE